MYFHTKPSSGSFWEVSRYGYGGWRHITNSRSCSTERIPVKTSIHIHSRTFPHDHGLENKMPTKKLMGTGPCQYLQARELTQWTFCSMKEEGSSTGVWRSPWGIKIRHWDSSEKRMTRTGLGLWGDEWMLLRKGTWCAWGHCLVVLLPLRVQVLLSSVCTNGCIRTIGNSWQKGVSTSHSE